MPPSGAAWLAWLATILSLALLADGALQDLYAEPFGLEARAELPLFLSFTTGANPAYSQSFVDDGSVRMMVSIELQVFCRPELEPCYYVTIGENMNCKKILECPNMPPLSRCVNGPFGILTLELRGTLESNTQYNLVVLSTLPPTGKRIQTMVVRTLKPKPYLDVRELVAIEELRQPINPEYMTQSASTKRVTGFELVTPVSALQGVAFQEYVFRVTGVAAPFASGDQLRIFSAPFLYPDEGLSFGGLCSGFDVAGFASPLRDCSCKVESIPASDTRVGFNVITLTFGPLANLAMEPQYFRIALNTPKQMGSMGLWYIASRDTYVLNDNPVFNKVLPAVGPFFVEPTMRTLTSLAAADTAFGAYQSLNITVYPRVNLIGSTLAPPKISVNSPTFHRILLCRNDEPTPDLVFVGAGTDAAYCEFQLVDNMNTYAHQSVTLFVGVQNPSFAVDAEEWHITVESGDGSMTSEHSFLGWPVYAALSEAFIMPMTMEYSQFNELEIFFRPMSSTPPEPRVIIAAPEGFRFEEPCDFEVLFGFPSQGVTCSNPLSEMGRNLFSLGLPMLTSFEAGTFYAASIYPLRNPYPGSHIGPLDDSHFRIDLVTTDGGTVLETSTAIGMGPNLGSFGIYPKALYQAIVTPSVRTPSVDCVVRLQFRTAARINVHGERLRLSAPYGYRWKIGETVYIFASDRTWPIAMIVYESSLPPVAPPHNQLEISLIDPDIPAGADVAVSGVIINAPIDPQLSEGLRSSNKWVVEFYEPGAGYTRFQFRHQAAVIPGYDLGAITAGSFSAWLAYSQQTQVPIMMTFRLGTEIRQQDDQVLMLQFIAPSGFYVPRDCAANRISPIHLEEDNYARLPEGSVVGCYGGGEEGVLGRERVTEVTLATGTVLVKRVVYALMFEAMLPDSLPFDNTWQIRVFDGHAAVEAQDGVPGFRLATEFLSAVYHPGTEDTGEDLRVGATDNRAMFSMQPSTAVTVGGSLGITAPYRFQFARDCRGNLFPAKHILGAVGTGSNLYSDLPSVRACVGIRNVARLTFGEDLDVAIRYTFRIAVINPLLPHPGDWPFPQNVWRVETFDTAGAPLNAAQVQAFYLWAFARALVAPLVLGAGETTMITVEVLPSLTVPPRGFLRISAPYGFVILVPCIGFQRDTYAAQTGFEPLPAGTACTRGAGGQHIVELRLDEFSYLAASLAFRFRLSIRHPAMPTLVRTSGEDWSIASAEVTDLGESFLERNPAIIGYPVHEVLKAFNLLPQSHRAEKVVPVSFEVALHDALGTFEVVTTTQASFLIVDMPQYFSVPVLSSGGIEPIADAGVMQPCTDFAPVYPPEPEYFPASEGGCYSEPGATSFRLLLVRNLLVGPDYSFRVGVLHPNMTSLAQRQIAQANVWQIRLVRVDRRMDVTYTTRSVAGYRIMPLLQNVYLGSAVRSLCVGASSRVSLSYRVVSAMSIGAGFLVELPASMSSLSGVAASTDVLCQLWVARALQPAAAFACAATESGALAVTLLSGEAVPEEAEVQLDFVIAAGDRPLAEGDVDNRWAVRTNGQNGTALDETIDIPGFVVYPSLAVAEIVPRDVSAMSYANHALFRFQVPTDVDPGASIVISAPLGFVLYPLTLRPEGLPGDNDQVPPSARRGLTESEAVISLPRVLAAAIVYEFHLTIGNPAVSPPDNEWALEVRGANNKTLSIDSRIPGFLVESQFNVSHIEGQLDEPLAENYVHVTLAVSQRLVADSILERSTCVPTVEEPVCPPRQGLQTFLVVAAPEGFVFQPTCGYWVLSRVGSRYSGLPPGSLCRVDPEKQNVARVQVSLSLEPLRTYEFTLQVRNAMSVPLENYWELRAMQDGVIRERNSKVEGFPLRQLGYVRITPSTTLAGVVDNTVTIQMRSERPLTRGANILVTAPVGFIFDADTALTSFPNPATARLQEPSVIRFRLSQLDYLAPNTYFFVSMRIRNPEATPVPNFWYFYLQSQYMEHIDLKKYFNGFAIAHKMYYCQVYPNALPWEFGASNDVSVLFVTQYPIFTKQAAYFNSLPALGDQKAEWRMTLVAPSGFTFPTENKYTDRCSGFRRWGGKDSYEQLPELGIGSISCTVTTARSITIVLPTSLINETRYSFRINATTAARREDIALQEPWRLTVLESGQILHAGESLSPLLGQYYEAEWFWAPSADNALAPSR